MLTAVITALALGIACAVLSVFVVTRRWAFIGEGIAHAGFGGAGTAWLLASIFPVLDKPAFLSLTITLFCLLTGLAIGVIHRRQRVNADAAIGIFLVASLAWGFLAQQIYAARYNQVPPGWESLLFGQATLLSPRYATMAVGLCAAVIVIVVFLRKEIIAYCVDPLLAQTSGVPAAFIHYLLMVLLALVITLGIRIAGSVLITALLILPGATALLLAQRLRPVMGIAIALGLLACLAGPLLHAHWHFIPQGPAIVLILFILFILTYTWQSLTRRGA